jgi:protoporphyrinogen/coproporphyrinogen III oxidase
MVRVAVVGGGIAGLGAAYTLKKAGVDVTVFEAASQAGGRMRSQQWGGAWVDRGAEFIADADLEEFRPLIADMGMSRQLISYPGSKVAFDVWRDGKPHPLSFTEISSILTFGAMSRRGKSQLARLLPSMARQFRRGGGPGFEPWRAAWADDQSIEEWLGKLAPEFLEYAIEPCYNLYCGWEPADTGRGTLVYMTVSYRQTESFTFPEGLGQLTRAVASRLNVMTNTRVMRVEVGRGPTLVEYEREGKLTRQIFDAVIVAVPGSKVAGLVNGLDRAREAFFEGVRYVPHESPYFKLKEKPEGVPARVFFPRREDRHIAGMGYEASTTTPSVEFLRVIMKTAFVRDMQNKSDDDVLNLILDEGVRRFPQIGPLVEDGFIGRWREGLPMFWPGYLRTLAAFMELSPLPGIAFAGDYLAGPSTGAAYVTGQRAVNQVLAYLSGRPAERGWAGRDNGWQAFGSDASEKINRHEQ